MYTVLRFSGSDVACERLESLGRHANEVVPGAFDGSLSKHGVLSLEVGDDPAWEVHRSRILEFLSRTSAIIRAARTAGARVWLDVAVQPEDLSNRNLLCLPLDSEQINEMAELGVGYEVSIYCLDASDRECVDRRGPQQ